MSQKLLCDGVQPISKHWPNLKSFLQIVLSPAFYTGFLDIRTHKTYFVKGTLMGC